MLGVIITVIIANFLAQRFEFMPQALWQIFLGIIIAIIPELAKIEIDLNPEWFMVLIIAPLLFYEGQQTKIKIVSKNIKEIVQLAVVLAFITIFCLTFSLKILFEWPIALALALASIATPTDATALESVKEGLEMPFKSEQALTFESMFNDATGLVALEFAGILASTGKFSAVASIIKFLTVSLGGAVFGIISALIIVRIRQGLLRKQLNDLTGHIMLQILTPLIIYMLAEELHVSGIIAVVIAGIFHREEQDRTLLQSSQMINLVNQFWKLLTDLLNGVVFVILGTTIVKIFAFESSFLELAKFLEIAFVLYIIMFLVRFGYIFKKVKKYKPAAIFAIGGVHGTVTLALALTIPVTLGIAESSTVVQELLVIAVFLILLSILVPLFILPVILEKKKMGYSVVELRNARTELANLATNYIDQQEIDKSLKKGLLLRVHSQMGYDVKVDDSIWQEINNQLNKKSDEAIRSARAQGTLSIDAVNLWDKMVLGNMQIKKKTIKKRHVYIEVIKYSLINLIRKFFRKNTIEDEIKRTKREISRLEKKNDKVKPVTKKNKIMKKIKMYKRRLYLLKNYANVDQRSRWINAYDELEEFLKPINNEFISQLEKQELDMGIIVALKQSILAQQTRMQRSLAAKETENTELSKVLQYELTQISLMVQNNKISSEVGKQLYNEVAAAQNLVFAS
ncbi:NhaP-type Na+ H+ and K+ H+ antiporter [Liquorilactobacillus cacaonum DSM 21116]|uniref:NhaP-type Na+ H+ and K+ H+ antiporter n=1 Tax=Liquorilactobacillus cacaonum DSM 21116 TaxID=1423729 RepID=A0A0R2CVP4_9LACO|nr:NhaP-type Na+ H+ and K+ H+ antiporter [Liquorilactobacillus cacaonum DSM 21116]